MKVLKLDKKHFISRKVLSIIEKEIMDELDTEVKFGVNTLSLERKHKKWIVKSNFDIEAEFEHLNMKRS